MSTENNLGVALVKELCPICCKEMDGPIIMNKRLTKPQKKKVEDMNGKIIGFADHCCEECAKYKDDAVFFVGIDESKSSKDSLKELYRTGQVVGIKKDADIASHFKDYIVTLKDNTKVIFIDEKAGKELKIFKD
ncbi:MAG: hypothetical protein ACI398_04120 [Clostridium sp.]